MNKTKTTMKHNRESARVATVHRHTAAQILQLQENPWFKALVINQGGWSRCHNLQVSLSRELSTSTTCQLVASKSDQIDFNRFHVHAVYGVLLLAAEQVSNNSLLQQQNCSSSPTKILRHASTQCNQQARG